MFSKKKILVIVTRRIGDVLLTTPLIRSLRQAWADAEIDVLVFSGTEGVLQGNPDINQILTVAARPKLGEHLRFLARLWRRYDLAIATMPSDRPLIYAKVASAYTLGMSHEKSSQQWKGKLFTQQVQFDDLNTHTVRMNLKLAELLNIPLNFQVVAGWRASDQQKLSSLLPFDLQRPYVVLHAHPMYVYKAWTMQGWVNLALWLQSRNYQIVLTGGNTSAETSYVAELANVLPNSVNLAGKINLAGVACLLKHAQLYVGPDTVVTHLAAASGIPTVALFGPSNPVKWGPWPTGYQRNENPYQKQGTQRVNNVVLVQGEADCVPCLAEGCDRNIQSLSKCLQQLPIEKVKNAVLQLLVSTGEQG